MTEAEKQDAERLTNTIDSLCSCVATIAECLGGLSRRLDALEAAHLEADDAPPGTFRERGCAA